MVSHRFHGLRPHWALPLLLLSTVGSSADGGSLAHLCLTDLETMGEKVWKPL